MTSPTSVASVTTPRAIAVGLMMSDDNPSFVMAATLTIPKMDIAPMSPKTTLSVRVALPSTTSEHIFIRSDLPASAWSIAM